MVRSNWSPMERAPALTIRQPPVDKSHNSASIRLAERGCMTSIETLTGNRSVARIAPVLAMSKYWHGIINI